MVMRMIFFEQITRNFEPSIHYVIKQEVIIEGI
jgi:hypothetical protein